MLAPKHTQEFALDAALAHGHPKEFALVFPLAQGVPTPLLRCNIVPEFIRKNLPCGEKTTAKSAVW